MSDDKDSAAPCAEDQSEQVRAFVLGVLSAEEQAHLEALMQVDPALREEALRWEAHFTALGMNVEVAQPPATVLGHLKRELWGENKLPWQRRIRIWEYALGGIAAALFAYFVFSRSDLASATAPVLRAQIEHRESNLQVDLALRRGMDLLHVEWLGPFAGAGRSFELWIVDDDAPPVSLGVLQRSRVSAVRLSPQKAALLQKGVTLALSSEAETGSASGAPSGAFIGRGAVHALSAPQG